MLAEQLTVVSLWVLPGSELKVGKVEDADVLTLDVSLWVTPGSELKDHHARQNIAEEATFHSGSYRGLN